MNLHLHLYQTETDDAVRLIQGFWKAHNQYEPSTEDALADLLQWTQTGHRFYLLELGGLFLTFSHICDILISVKFAAAFSGRRPLDRRLRLWNVLKLSRLVT